MVPQAGRENAPETGLASVQVSMSGEISLAGNSRAATGVNHESVSYTHLTDAVGCYISDLE